MAHIVPPQVRIVERRVMRRPVTQLAVGVCGFAAIAAAVFYRMDFTTLAVAFTVVAAITGSAAVWLRFTEQAREVVERSSEIDDPAGSWIIH